MRRLVLLLAMLVIAGTAVYAASMTGTAKMLGGGIDTVPHCQALHYDIAASDTITSINAQVKCDVTGSYNVTATVTSGVNSGSGQTAASLTANTAATVAVTISPSVAISSSNYSADILVKK